MCACAHTLTCTEFYNHRLTGLKLNGETSKCSSLCATSSLITTLIEPLTNAGFHPTIFTLFFSRPSPKPGRELQTVLNRMMREGGREGGRDP